MRLKLDILYRWMSCILGLKIALPRFNLRANGSKVHWLVREER